MRFHLTVFILLHFGCQIFSQQNTNIIAHRGAWKNGNLPQNSIAALKNAINLKCYGAEFDVRMTLDNVLIINHDAEFVGLEIEKTTYKDLSKNLLKNGEKLPTLKKYLKAGKNQSSTFLVLEIKPSPAGKEQSLVITEKTVALVKKLKMQKQIIYISFDYDVLKKIMQLEPTAITQYLNGDKSIEQLKSDKISGADYHFSVFEKDEDWIKNAHNQGLITNAWTVNQAENLEFLLARKIQNITTDEPELAMQMAEQYKAKKRALVWSDEFNYTGLPNPQKWTYDVGGSGWGNNELQYYLAKDSSTAYVNNKVLKIKANKVRHENKEYTSARLLTQGLAEWQYGFFEVRAKLPKGRGTWPAIWMLATDIQQVGWPKAGEIDIMEHVGFDPDTLVGTVHTQSYNHTIGTQISKKIGIKNPYTEFHIYALDWSADKLDFLLDNQVYLSIKNPHKTINEWPFDKPYFLLLNLAIGGNWGGAKGVDESIFPAQYEIDYVRVFKKE